MDDLRLITKVHVFTESNIHEGYVVLIGSKIQKIGIGSPETPLLQKAVEVIEGSGGLLLPGFIDTHVHLRDLEQSSKETQETGTKAAICGGVTTVLTMPNTQPPLTSPDTIENYSHLPRHLYCNVGIIAGVSTGFCISEVEKLVNLGIYGLKVFPGGGSVDVPLEWDEYWKSRGNLDKPPFELHKLTSKFNHSLTHWHRLFEIAKKFSLPIFFHPELAYSATEYAEKFNHSQNDERTFRSVKNPNLMAHNISHGIPNNEFAHIEMICSFIQKLYPHPTDAPQVHFCHLTNAPSITFINTEMKKISYPISFEVTPHHMLLHYGMQFPHENYAKVLTPIRSPLIQQAVWEKVQEGKIDTIATDHAPHTEEEKLQDFQKAPSGFPSIDIAARLLLTQVFDFQLAMDKFVMYYSTRPAQLFRFPTKGKIAPGFDADLVIIERTHPQPIVAKESCSLAKWSPYEGMKVKAKIAKVILGGELVLDTSQNLFKSKGKFIRRVDSQM
jgi:dihydroorotase